MERLVHLYYGDGKGKTTAAVGLAVRAAGAGQNVLFVQFMKGGRTGEVEILRGLSHVTVLRCDREFPFYRQMTPEQKEEQTALHNRMLEQIERAVKEGRYEMLVLDEVTYPYARRLFDRKMFRRIFERAKGGMEIVCTGRDPDAFFLEFADYATEMKCVRHPFARGVKAREGEAY